MTDNNIRHFPTAIRVPTRDELIADSEPRFEVIDADRAYATNTHARFIMDTFGWVEPLDYRDDTWKSMPLRLVHDLAGGWQIEVGCYNLDASDIHALREAITAYDQAVGR